MLKIKEYREFFQFTQKELAAKVGTTQRNISNWENGLNEPDCDTLIRLADVFEISLDELFGRSINSSREIPKYALKSNLLGLIASFSEKQQTFLYDFLRNISIFSEK